MTGSVPSGPRLDRDALERIIRRAAELQASERDLSEGLTEQELLALGREVGIGESYLRQALLEERSRSLQPPERDLLARLAGRRRVAAQRTIPRPKAEAEAALHAWLADGELLQIKRRYPEQTTWEAQQGAFASLKRALRARGRRYLLARAREVGAQVVELDAQRCHVQLAADLGNLFREQLTGAALLASAGAAIGALALVAGVLAPFSAVPVVLGVASAWAVARRQRRRAEEIQVALEQVLDRLEHGALELPRAAGPPALEPLVRVADQLRRSLKA